MPWEDFRSRIKKLRPSEQERILEALAFAEKTHAGQKRFSGDPYITHPITVATNLASIGADADTIVAALLHDTVEDTPVTLEDIERRFGHTVATLIDGVTKLTAEELAGKPSLDEKIETIRKIFTLMERDIRIIVIKLYDRLHNIQTAEFLPEAKRRELAIETLEIYVRIADRLCMRDVQEELEGCCIAILEPDVYPKLQERRRESGEQGKQIAREMQRELYPSPESPFELIQEAKTWDKTRMQLQMEGTVVTGLSVAIVAIICPSIDACYRMLGLLHQRWKREVLSFQDYINAPMINGYKGLHTTVILEDGSRVRCKIRTKEMQDYALRGISALAFRERPIGLLEVIPWAQRIGPLSKDTENRSAEFWQSLQSDILGESIVIHGPDDRTRELPKGSTALDGVFYLFGAMGIYTKEILVNGMSVPFYDELPFAASVSATFDAVPHADRSWLQYVHTGIASAAIHEELAKAPEEEKETTGRRILQTTLKEQRNLELEELSEDLLEKLPGKLGLPTLSQMYIQIAEGKQDPQTITSMLFSTKKKAAPTHRWILRVTYSTALQERLGKMIRSFPLLSLSYREEGAAQTLVAVYLLTEQQTAKLRSYLVGLLPRDAWSLVQSKKEPWLWLAALSVILLWALNPVIAKLLLQQGMELLPLITIRMLVFSVYTCIFFVVWRLIVPTQFSTIPRITAIAFPPAMSNVVMTFLTYLSIHLMPPSIHLTILRFNTLLLPSHQSRSSQGIVRLPVLLLFLITVSGALLLLTLGPSFFSGIALSFLTLFSYVLYSLTTERALQQNKIDIRYPYLLFHMGLLIGFFGLLLIPWQSIEGLWNNLTLSSILYVLACVCIPHTCYTALLKSTRFTQFSDLLILEIPLAIVFEMLLLGVVLPPFTYVSVFAILAVLLLRRWNIISMLVR